MKRRAVLVTGFTIALLACGGSASAPPAKSPVSAPGSEERVQDSAAPAEAPIPTTAPVAPPAPEAAGAASPSGDRDSRAVARQGARAELEAAERDLDQGAGDCTTACRALASMSRATTHLCDLADGPDDRRRCDDAKRKLAAARDRVERACRGC